MIDNYEWLKDVRSVIREIADPEFQERVWVRGEGPEVSSWTEAMCKLFDDYHFDDFLDKDWQQFGLSSQLHESLDCLRIQLNEYEEKETDAEIVSDSKWQKNMNIAKEVLLHLDREMKAGNY